MLGKTHKLGGIATGFVAATAMSVYSPYMQQHIFLGIPLIAGGWVGGLMPDIDHPNSTMGRRLWFLSRPINKIFGHRGFTHTILGLILSTLGIFLLSFLVPPAQTYISELITMFAIGYGLGYANHLFLDSLNPTGTPLFFPFTSKSFRLARIPTGKYEGMVQCGIIACTVSIVIGMVYAKNPPVFQAFVEAIFTTTT